MASNRPTDDSGPGLDLTSQHVRRAVDGDAESLSWVITRLSAPLLVQARYRLGKVAAAPCEPEDLVAEVWLRVLPELGRLKTSDAHFTRVLMRFLSTTLLNHVNNLFRRHARGKPATQRLSGVDLIDEHATGVVTAVIEKEACGAVIAALEALSDAEREVVILCGIEQNPPREVAVLLSISPNAVSQRYRRAMRRLRRLVPDSIFHELAADVE